MKNIPTTYLKEYSVPYTESALQRGNSPPEVGAFRPVYAAMDLADGEDKTVLVGYFPQKKLFVVDTADLHAREDDILIMSPCHTRMRTVNRDMANRLLPEGWITIGSTAESMACDACWGYRQVDGKTCWHCHGEGMDPTKVRDE